MAKIFEKFTKFPEFHKIWVQEVYRVVDYECENSINLRNSMIVGSKRFFGLLNTNLKWIMQNKENGGINIAPEIFEKFNNFSD